MSAKHLCSLIAAMILAAFAGLPPSAALAQSRQFSFAYDQPKTSGYGAGAEIFNARS